MTIKYRFRQGWFGNQILQVCHSPRPDQKTMVAGWCDANQEEADEAYMIVRNSTCRAEWDFRPSSFGKYVLYVNATVEVYHFGHKTDSYQEWRKARATESRNIFLALNENN